MHASDVADLNLAPTGRQKMTWALDHMPVLSRLRGEFQEKKPLAGYRVGICLHLEAKTACLAETFHQAGAEVFIAGSNPLSTQDDVCAALSQSGVTVYAHHNPPMELYKRHQEQVLEARPQLLLDDGADLVGLLHSTHAEYAEQMLGVCEETTTGVHRLRALESAGELRFPALAVNDAASKCLFDNRYGTGQTVWDNLNGALNLIVAGKMVVVVGFGWCGKGVAMRARGLGAQVIVCEVDPIRAVEAHMEGFAVMPMHEAASRGDIFVTVTGMHGVINHSHFALMRDGAILANAGHFDVEIDRVALEKFAIQQKEGRRHVTTYTLPHGCRIHLVAEGRLVNLAAGDGHPAEIMDMTFSLQALGMLYLLKNHKELPKRVLPMPEALDKQVSQHFLDSMRLKIDSLTPAQETYLSSWASQED